MSYHLFPPLVRTHVLPVPMARYWWAFFSQVEQLTGTVSVLAYALHTLRWLQRQSPESSARLAVGHYRWIKQLLWTYTFLWLIWLGYTLINVIVFAYGLSIADYYPLYLFVAGLTYWLGLPGYLKPAPQGAKSAVSKGFHHTWTTQQRQAHQARLSELVTTSKLYLDPALNLTSLAQLSGMTTHAISFILNQHMQIGLTATELKKLSNA